MRHLSGRSSFATIESGTLASLFVGHNKRAEGGDGKGKGGGGA